MSVTSDDVDYLVWRYLVESGVAPAVCTCMLADLLLHLPMHRLHKLLCHAGYTHSAFTFSNEGSIGKQRYNTDSVSTGALVHLLQRGMQYMELEANLAEVSRLSVPGDTAWPDGCCCRLMLGRSPEVSQRPVGLCCQIRICQTELSSGLLLPETVTYSELSRPDLAPVCNCHDQAPLGWQTCVPWQGCLRLHTRCAHFTAEEALLLQDVHNVEAPFLSVPGEDVLMKDAGELKEDLQQRKEEERHKVALRLEQQHK